MSRHPRYRLSCDTMVALAPATTAGVTLFAKNSDRPALEAQPLRQFPRREYPAGETLRTQYLEIPQVAATAATIGSQPHWLWGFEHGLNEHRVAIGNEAIFTKQYPADVGLLGMDLVRLGLERGRTADEALEVITDLVERYGQGGAPYEDLDFRYNNSFIICDPSQAWIVETSGHHWVARRAQEVDSISNEPCIAADWERKSDGVEGFAAENGWADGEGHFDFQAAYRDRETVPPVVSAGRLRQSRAILGDTRGHVTPARLRSTLRDHYGRAAFAADDPSQESYYSICMHADPSGTTTASIIAQLPADPGRIPVYWASLATPCTSSFLPLFIDGTIPKDLGRATGEATPDSPWWQFKALQDACAVDFPGLTPKVQAIFHTWEEETDAAVERVRSQAEAVRAGRDEATVHDLLTRFMAEKYAELQALWSEATATIRA